MTATITQEITTGMKLIMRSVPRSGICELRARASTSARINVGT